VILVALTRRTGDSSLHEERLASAPAGTRHDYDRHRRRSTQCDRVVPPPPTAPYSNHPQGREDAEHPWLPQCAECSRQACACFASRRETLHATYPIGAILARQRRAPNCCSALVRSHERIATWDCFDVGMRVTNGSLIVRWSRDECEDPDADAPGVAIGSYASCLPGVIGPIGILAAAVAYLRRRRHRTRT
jgi:hypothetical protein